MPMTGYTDEEVRGLMLKEAKAHGYTKTAEKMGLSVIQFSHVIHGRRKVHPLALAHFGMVQMTVYVPLGHKVFGEVP